MDTIDIIKTLEKLFPILIFLIWVLFSVLANAKKRGPAGKPVPRADERPSYDNDKYRQQESDEKPQISDDLRRTLETIFGESPVQVEEKVPEREPEPSSVEKYESEKSEEPSVIATQMEIQRAYEEAQRKLASLNETHLEPQLSSNFDNEQSIGDELTISHDEVRKGFIWSEILGPPVSMR